MIEIGRRNEAAAEVVTGLEAGEQVVLYPTGRVVDGSRIEPRKD